MVAIDSMLFCDACGSLLPRVIPGENKDDMIQCDDCSKFTKDTSSKIVTSRSKPTTFPSSLRDKLSDVQVVDLDEMQVESVISKTCPNCDRKEMFYHTKQLRSADEGTTVFYRCECGYKDVQNN